MWIWARRVIKAKAISLSLVGLGVPAYFFIMGLLSQPLPQF